MHCVKAPCSASVCTQLRREIQHAEQQMECVRKMSISQAEVQEKFGEKCKNELGNNMLLARWNATKETCKRGEKYVETSKVD